MVDTIADRDDALELLRLMRCPMTTDRIDMLSSELAARRSAAERAGMERGLRAAADAVERLARKQANAWDDALLTSGVMVILDMVNATPAPADV